MRVLITIAVVVSSACASQPRAPKQRYIDALNQKMSGNAKGYYDGLISLANDAPETRAGRRARATLGTGSLLVEVGLIGMVAAIAIPNFTKFRERAEQTSVKVELRSLGTAMASYRAEYDRYCASFAECGWEPASNSQYLYYLSVDEVLGGGGAGEVSLLRLRAEGAFASMGIVPAVTATGFLIVAAGDPDGDGELDVWAIDENFNVVNLLKD